VKSYSLLAGKNWECNLEEMDQLVDSHTKAILINNPSNPCGSNYSAEHLSLIVEVARKHGLPIIADEIYGGCVFDGMIFYLSIS
jgi:tyrosine aminotransferase